MSPIFLKHGICPQVHAQNKYSVNLLQKIQHCANIGGFSIMTF